MTDYEHTNRHHLLFTKHMWQVESAHNLREHFVYRIDIKTHNYLHNHVIKSVPLPPAHMVAKAWKKCQRERNEISKMGVLEAIKWLQEAMPDPKFVKAMQIQYDYLSKELGQ